jgi:hypothetical protein
MPPETFSPPGAEDYSWKSNARYYEAQLNNCNKRLKDKCPRGNYYKYVFWSGWLVAIGCGIAIGIIMASQRPDPVKKPAVPANTAVPKNAT